MKAKPKNLKSEIHSYADYETKRKKDGTIKTKVDFKSWTGKKIPKKQPKRLSDFKMSLLKRNEIDKIRLLIADPSTRDIEKFSLAIYLSSLIQDLKMKQNQITSDNDKEFYIAVEYKKDDFIVYTSDPFFLSEFDILSLIKLCYVRKRNKIIGKKLLEIYKDSTKDREFLTQKRLNLIGIKPNETPTTTNAKHSKTK